MNIIWRFAATSHFRSDHRYFKVKNSTDEIGSRGGMHACMQQPIYKFGVDDHVSNGTVHSVATYEINTSQILLKLISVGLL